MAHYNIHSQAFRQHRALPEKVSTLIVGAGMSGLYNAWRLREEKQEDVIILEQSWRTGGRLDSDVVEIGKEKVKEEEGGMRFTFQDMDNLMALFMLLEIDKEIVPFPMKTGGNNRLCFRGHSFNTGLAAADNFAIWKKLYNLLPSEQDINPGSIIDTVFNRILAANPQFEDRPAERTPEFWQKFRLECNWKGVPLTDWTLWNLYTDMGYSREVINLLCGLAGFNGTFLSTMNAGEAYQLLEDFPADPDFKTLQNGFSTLPNALVKRLGEEHIFLNTAVTSIDEIDAEHCVVSFRQQNAAGEYTEGHITANRVILCIPRLSMEKLFNRSNALNRLEPAVAEHLWNTLQTTTNQPLVKVNLYFEKAWWGTNSTGQPSVGYGPNFSDLPTGAVYPFYAIDEPTIAALEYEKLHQQDPEQVPPEIRKKLQQISEQKFNKPAALTIYCDFANVNFWQALQNNGPKFQSPLQEKYSSKVPQSVFPASQAVVDAAIGFFKQLFNTNYVPAPVLTSARIWQGSTLFNEDPAQQFGYGVHQWGLSADDKEVIAFMTQPLEGMPLYTCGESYSDYQGWVEGALRSANLVLEKAFGLSSIAEKYRSTHDGETPNAAAAKSYALRSAEMIAKYITNNTDEATPDARAIVEAQGEQGSPFTGISLSYFDVPNS